MQVESLPVVMCFQGYSSPLQASFLVSLYTVTWIFLFPSSYFHWDFSPLSIRVLRGKLSSNSLPIPTKLLKRTVPWVTKIRQTLSGLWHSQLLCLLLWPLLRTPFLLSCNLTTCVSILWSNVGNPWFLHFVLEEIRGSPLPDPDCLFYHLLLEPFISANLPVPCGPRSCEGNKT